MPNKQIHEFPTLPDIQDTDLVLISSTQETYNTKAKTFKDYASGEAQNAVNQAQNAVVQANSAKETANQALTVAQGISGDVAKANETASAAKSAAESASAKADEANSSAESAVSKANGANDTANSAKEIAERALSAAGGASGDVSQATEAANAAKTAAEAAEKKANAAELKASSALSTAESALVAAAGAESEVGEFAGQIDDLKKLIAETSERLGIKIDGAYVEDGYLYMTAEEEIVVGPLGPFSGGGGGGDTGSTLRIVNKMPSRSFSVMEGETVNIEYSWSSIDNADGSETGNGSAIWQVNGTRVSTQTVAQGDNSFDVTNRLTPASANTVKLTIEDGYGNTRSFTWTVTVTFYALSWNLDKIAVHGSASLFVRLVPTGDGTKTIHIACDGKEVFTEEVSTSGRAVTTSINAQSHGSHVITAWMTATANNELVTTDTLRHVGIWAEIGNETPILAVYKNEVEIPQFATGLIEYMVYDPTSEESSIELLEGSNVVSTLTVDRNIQQWAYRPTKIGDVTLTIKMSETIKENVLVKVSSLGYDIHPVTDGLVMDIDPTGHSNTEVNREQFGYKDSEGKNHPFEFSDNFDWINGGFQLDEKGVTAFVIKRGTYITADRSLFNDNASNTGKEIKVVFRATNVRDYDAEIIRCVSGRVGLTLQAQQAVLSSELKTAAVPYCEDRQIEMDVNIESTKENRLAVVWLRGVPSRGFNYTESDNWTQAAPVPLKIGSEDCDVWLYRLKMYGNSLTRNEVLDNFVADCGDTEDMLARFLRNDIFNVDGSINIEKLSNANKTLRILKIGAERITTGKSDPVPCSVQLIFAEGGDEKNFTATNVIMKVQGTSSAAYGEAAYNLDLDFSNAVWTLGNGDTIIEYAMTPNSVPVSYFNIKLNVASSENANNACLADDYNNYQPFLPAQRREDQRVRDTVEGHPCAVFFTNTSDATISVGARKVKAGETILYGNGDMNNSKKNFAVFGQDSEKYPEQCCVEILNNIADQCRFKSDDLSAELFDGDGNFEFRYPKKPTEGMKSKFHEMLSWVVSTDAEAATGNALLSPVKYGNKTYSNDSAEYRAAKFVNEFDNYFNRKSMLFHYLFTERHCMIDNRAKNVFLSYELDPDIGEYRWNANKDYDNDTADGNDNEGGLTFTYGIEDTDTVGTKMAYNASDSVLWCNIRDFMAADLEAMFKDREAAGAWNAKRILKKFSDHQSARPEALVVEDMWGKYFAPYINNANPAYIAMMQGNKTDQREQFETYQERYMSTKYYGSVATSEAITFRANTPNEWSGVKPTGDIAVKLYHDAYIIAKYGSQSVRMRAKRGQAYLVKSPVSEALSDTEIYFYLASNVTEIGPIPGLYCQYIDLAPAYRLRKIVAGSEESGYSNENLTSVGFGKNILLEYIDLRGTPALTHDLDLSDLNALTTLLLTGSGVTGVTFAHGAPVITAELPMLNSLTARRLSQLQTFKMRGNNLLKIWVEETPIIDTFTLTSAATELNRGRLPDINWNIENADVLLKLSRLSGLDGNGNTTTDTFVLGGSCHVDMISQLELTAVENAFPNLSLTYGQIVPSYTVTFKHPDGTVLNTQTVRKYGSAVNPVTAGIIPPPTKPMTVESIYAFAGWDKPLTDIQANTIITAVFSEITRTYVVKHWNGDTLIQTDTVDAHGSVSYRGDDLVGTGDSIWMGWDAPTNDVVSDIDVHAVYVSPVLPDSVASNFDYLYSDDPNDKSGYTLAEFYGIIYNNRAKEYFSVGDEIKILPITNVFADTEIVMQVYGFNHFKLADGSGNFANAVFGMKGVMNTGRAMNTTSINKGGYAATNSMRPYLEKVYNALPQQWKAMIKLVEVLSSAGNTSPNIVSSNDRLFLFSQSEVGFNRSEVPYKNEVDEGAEELTFSLFTDNNSRIKKTYNGAGSAMYWWLRSPAASSSSSFCSVASSGNSNNGIASTSYSVAFGFCL